MIEAIEPEAELFALAEQVDLAEKAFHDALVRRNEAQIAYLRQPNILSRKAFEAEKKLSQSRVIRFDGSQARRQHRRRHVATLRMGNHESIPYWFKSPPLDSGSAM